MEEKVSNLKKFIQDVKNYSKENGLSQMETVRYVYLELGKHYNFDVDFAYGNKKTREKIYSEPATFEELEKKFDSKVAVCKHISRTVSSILSNILSELDFEVTEEKDYSTRKYAPHVYNVIKINGKSYVIDLTLDLENIQANARTKYFGLSYPDEKKQVISNYDLEQMDRKFGYISDKAYYSDDYLDLLKMYIFNLTNVNDKIDFILRNISPYTFEKEKYGTAERQWRHMRILEELLTQHERDKVRPLKAYYLNDEEHEEYINGFLVFKVDKTSFHNRFQELIYIFDDETNSYKNCSFEQFYNLQQKGLNLGSRSTIVGYDEFLARKFDEKTK